MTHRHTAQHAVVILVRELAAAAPLALWLECHWWWVDDHEYGHADASGPDRKELASARCALGIEACDECAVEVE